MELYYHHDATVLDKYTRIFVPKLKGKLLNTLNNELVMDHLSYSGHSFVNLNSKNKQLYFALVTRIIYNHKRLVKTYKIQPVLLGKVKNPFFKGHNPYIDLEGEYI